MIFIRDDVAAGAKKALSVPSLISTVDRKYSNGLHVDYPFKRRRYIQIQLAEVL